MYIDYYKYIESKEWKNKREELFKLMDKVCIKCGSNKNIQVHHKSYINLGKETTNDLVALCGSCHLKLHQIEKILECKLDVATRIFLKTCRRTESNSPIKPKKERRDKFIKIRKCRKCGFDLVLIKPFRKHIKKNQLYYFTHYWKCNSCNTMYMDNKYRKTAKNNDLI